MRLIHNATSDPHPDEQDQRPHRWMSLDGEHWLEFQIDDEDGNPVPLTAERYAEVKAHFEGESTPTRRTRPITVATAYLRCWCPNFKVCEPIQVPDEE